MDPQSAQPLPFVDITRSGFIMAASDRSFGAPDFEGAFAHSRGSPPPGVSLRYRWSGGWLVAEVAGDLDLEVVPLLSALGRDPRFVVFDLHGVTFMDCSCLHAVMNARCEAVSSGGAVYLAAPSQPVLRLLRLTGLDEALPTFDTVSAATALPPVVGSVHQSPIPGRPRWSSTYWRSE